MWQAKQSEGFVELEQDYARLLKSTDGVKWSSKIVTPDGGDIWTPLKKAIPEFFAPKVTLNFICSELGGVSVIEFPNNTTDKDIESNLQINRKNFFNIPEELCFKLKKGAVNQITNKREMTVSFATKSVITSIESLCGITDTKLGKITTLPNTLVGALKRQYGDQVGKAVNILIQIGYSKVYIVILKGTEIISVRSLLTGSLRELENVLFAGYSLPKEDARLMLSNRHPQPIPAIMDTIRENRSDFLANFSGIIAELRTKKMLTKESMVYMSYSIIDEPMLTSMISQRFDTDINILTGMLPDEAGANYEDYPAGFSCGASDIDAPNLIPEKEVSISSFLTHPSVAIIIALIMTCLPYSMINQKKNQLNAEVTDLKAKHAPVEALLQEFKDLAAYQTKLVSLASQINNDIEKRGISARIARHITENLPVSTRLENLNVDYKSGKLKLVGYTVDAESALRYLDSIRGCDELKKPEIVISDLESRRIKFTITAIIGDGKGIK